MLRRINCSFERKGCVDFMKRKIALLTTLMVALYSFCAFSAPFSDMPKADSEYYDAARYAIDNDIISGDDGELMLAEPLTRAQAAVIMARAASLPLGKELEASDVDKDAWYYGAAVAAVDAGLMELSDGKFFPDEPLNREDAFLILQNTYNIEDSADLSAYTDLSKLTPDGRNALSALIAAQVVKIKGSAIEPASDVSRGDFVLWLYNAVMLDPSNLQSPTQEASEATEPNSEAAQPSTGATEKAEAETQSPTDESDPTEAETQPPTDAAEAADAAQALEIMRVALGIRADGTSYVERDAYRDTIQEMNYSSSGRTSTSSGSTTKPTNPKPTNPPTEPENDEPTTPSTPTEPKTEPTEPSDFDGNFDNDKDNTVDDPFDDDWKNPGGGDGEDDDFFPNDEDDPAETPTKPEENPSDTDTPSEPEENPSEENPSEEETSTESEEPSEEAPTDTEGDTPTEPEEPSEPFVDMDSPSEDENGSENGENAGEADAFIAALFKAWWFI